MKAAEGQRSILSTIPSDSTWTPSEPPNLEDVTDIELDFETTGLKWWDKDRYVGVAVGWEDRDGKYHTQYIPERHRGGGNLPPGTIDRWLRTLRKKRITNINSRFDNHIAYSDGVDLESQGCTWSDIGHYASLLDDHRRTFSLEDLSQEVLGRGKVKGINPEHIADYHAGDVEAYACGDVRNVHDIKKKLQPKIEAEGLKKVLALEDACIYPVCEMERNGAPLDMGLLERWVGESEQTYLRLLWEVHRETGLRVDPNKRGDMVALFRKENIPITHFTENEQPSFEDNVLANLCWNPSIKKIRQAKKLDSLRSKYILKYWETARETGGILRYALHQLRTDEGGTISGRFSSSGIKTNSRTYGANIQQVMSVGKQREAFGFRADDSSHDDEIFMIRSLFLPGDGLFLSADAMQIEFRIFAHYSEDQQLYAAYEKDPYVSFHQVVWDMVKPYADIPYKNVKNLNFAKIYGAGLAKIALMLGLSIEEATSFVASYDRAFPAVRRLLNEASTLAEKRGYVKTFLGRRTRFPHKHRVHKALNGVIQGGAADIMKQKLIELYRVRKELGLTLRMTVHDEVTGDVPDAESARRVGEILNMQSFKMKVPILWDVATGQNWAKCA